MKMRTADESDIKFIYSSWLKSFRRSPFAAQISNALYFDGQHKRITHILAKPETNVICVCNPEDASQIYGWICAEIGGPITVVHYVYVKRTYRGFGIGKGLIESLGSKNFIFTHDTGFAQKFGGVYSPYLAMEAAA